MPLDGSPKRRRRPDSPARPWPADWTGLDDFYAGSWSLMEAQRVSRAERSYQILLHWHERVMVVDAEAAPRNWCPLCPPSWGDAVARFQVPPERRPFDDLAMALRQWDSWLRQRSRGDWLQTSRIAQELSLRAYTRVIVGDPHSTLTRLTERLAGVRSPGLQFCAHVRENVLGPFNTTPVFVPEWAVAADPQTPCPLCLMAIPAWPAYTPTSPSLPEDVHARPDGDLYAAVREVQDNGVHRYDPDDIDCPDCRRVQEWRRDHRPKEPAPTDEWVF